MPFYDLLVRSTGPKGPSLVADSQGLYEGSYGSYTLANVVLRTLFTTKGTVPTSRSEGTALPLLAGNVVDLDHAKAVAISSISDAESYIKKQQLRSPVSKDETLSKLVLKNVLVGDGPSLVIRVLVYSASDAVIPLEVTV